MVICVYIYIYIYIYIYTHIRMPLPGSSFLEVSPDFTNSVLAKSMFLMQRVEGLGLRA